MNVFLHKISRFLLLCLIFTTLLCGCSPSVSDIHTQSLSEMQSIMQEVSPFATEKTQNRINQTFQNVLKRYNPNSSLYDTYQLFETLAASLGEGHAGVFAPQELLNTLGQLPVKIKYLDGAYYISDTLPSNTQLLYRQVTAVNQIPIEEYLSQTIEPLISFTTPNAKQQKAADRLAVAPNGETITLELQDNSGNRNSYELTYSTANNTTPFVGLSSLLSETLSQTDILYSSPNFVYAHIQNKPYLALFGFQDTNLYTEFARHIFPLLQDETQLILDIRTNNGGNGKTAKDILFLLTGQESEHYPFSESKTDLSALAPISEEMSAEVARQHQLTPLHLSQIALLTSHTAYSAADDFVFYAKQSPTVTTIGTNTGGATGMVQFFELANGFTFCCSVLRDFDQSHTDITGNGIQPDIWVWQTIDDAKNKQDTALNKAVSVLG